MLKSMAISISAEDFIGSASDLTCMEIQAHERHMGNNIHFVLLMGLPASED
jgi:hypothetical protein